jgi:hypothetical protein
VARPDAVIVDPSISTVALGDAAAASTAPPARCDASGSATASPTGRTSCPAARSSAPRSRAVAAEPTLLHADEPTGALDLK